MLINWPISEGAANIRRQNLPTVAAADLHG
jgi:hypothetical protein